MLEKLVRQFLEHCEIEKGRSLLTIRNYEHYLGRFLNWAKENGIKSPEDITLEKIRQYRLYLNRLSVPPAGEAGKDKNLSSVTQNYHLIALRAFLRYLVSRDIKTLSADKIELAKVGERQINFLTSQEIDQMISQVPDKNLKDRRDRAILETLFSTGMRVSELVSLNRDGINLETGEASVRGKGEKVRVVFLSDKAKIALKKYIDSRRDSDSALFIRHGRQKERPGENLRLTVRQVQRVIRYYAKKAGIVKKVTPHTMRHSFATDLLMSGGDIRSVQQLLGHASITTTQIYTHITDPHLRDVHRAFHGRMRKQEEQDEDKKDEEQ